jgi:hypothetical protein
MKSRSLLLLIALMGAGSLRAQAPAPTGLDALLTNSPFGQRASDNGATAPGAALELRGVIVDSGEVLFSLFDPAAKASRWVGLNEPGNPFTVRSYDSAKGEVKVAYQGRDIVLGLKQATVIALAAPPVAVPISSVNPPPNAASGPPNDEAVRLAQIAEEIARRRALRAQARQQANPAIPTPAPPK